MKGEISRVICGNHTYSVSDGSVVPVSNRVSNPSRGRSSARQSACFASRKSWVQVPSSPLRATPISGGRVGELHPPGDRRGLDPDHPLDPPEAAAVGSDEPGRESHGPATAGPRPPRSPATGARGLRPGSGGHNPWPTRLRCFGPRPGSIKRSRRTPVQTWRVYQPLVQSRSASTSSVGIDLRSAIDNCRWLEPSSIVRRHDAASRDGSPVVQPGRHRNAIGDEGRAFVGSAEPSVRTRRSCANAIDRSTPNQSTPARPT